MHKKYQFEAQLWLYPGKAAWHFITVPTDIAQEIDFYFAHVKKGWGSLPVSVTIGETQWQTSIFPDKKTSSYLLPVKTEVRKKESLQTDQTLKCVIELSDA